MPDTAHISPSIGSALAPVRVEGRFFWAGDEKLFLRGVTYGPFPPDVEGSRFPRPEMMATDFAAMASAGVNTVRTFTAPSPALLEAAARVGLRVMAGLAWPHHQAFLDDPETCRSIIRGVRAEVHGCGRHPAILAYLVGNEIGPDLLRWHGADRVAAFLDRLAAAVRVEDPGTLVSYAGYPTAEFLEPKTLDFTCFNVYLHETADFRRYLARLHNRAGFRPLVLSEVGMDSQSEGLEHQAAFLDATLDAAFDGGAAGVCVFAWTDEWHTGGRLVEDWSFGLVDAGRTPKPALEAVRRNYQVPLPPPLPAAPMVSVVVCAYNAERTLQPCLEALQRLSYPRLELILVDDGSRDGTPDIAARFPGVRVIHQENRGLSFARNVGAQAATGDIVAYTDADCVVDPHWLHFLVRQFQTGDHGAVGGPNLPPPEAALVPAAVAASPGGPTHVLLTDTLAEHIAGCNMAFRRELLLGLGGFDPQFRTAGDDVDICWRVQDGGHTIGYAAAAMVWHFRRSTVAAYFAQQRGYGKAEARVWRKHPSRFNGWGQARWRGRIYGGLTAGLLRPGRVVYSGAYGRAPFQLLYAAPEPWPLLLPQSFEWAIAALALAVGGLGAGLVADPRWVLLLLPLAISLAQAAATAGRAPLDPRFEGPRARALVSYLTFLSPLLRGWSRMIWRWRLRPKLRGPSSGGWNWRRFAAIGTLQTTQAWDKPQRASDALQALRDHGLAVADTAEWRSHDMEVFQDPLMRHTVTLATDQLDVRHQLQRLRVAPVPTTAAIAVTALAACISFVLALAGRPIAALVPAVCWLGTAAWVLAQARATALQLLGILHASRSIGSPEPTASRQSPQVD